MIVRGCLRGQYLSVNGEEIPSNSMVVEESEMAGKAVTDANGPTEGPNELNSGARDAQEKGQPMSREEITALICESTGVVEDAMIVVPLEKGAWQARFQNGTS